MATGGSALNLIRNFFYRDRVITQPYDTKGYTFNQYTGREGAMGAATPVGSVYNQELINSTEINLDLVGRYADYEDMEAYPELGQALNIYADDATQQDAITGKSIWIESPEEAVTEILEHTLHKQLEIEDDLWTMARSLAHKGNIFQEIIVLDNVGVIKLIDYQPQEMRRVSDKFGNDFGFIWDEGMSFSMSTDEFMRRLHDRDQGQNTTPYAFMQSMTKVFEDWEMVHYRLRTGSRGNTLYGSSILEPARWVWKRMQLLEDAMVLFKLTRAPQRYVFYVDVGDVPPNEARKIINNYKNDFRKQKFINPETGTMQFKYNPLSLSDDYFISKRKEKRSSEIEVLSGLADQGTEDANYFRDKLFAALGIPKSYLGADETIGRANLCLVPETRIPLFDGRTVTMEQLIEEHNQGKQNYTYSINKDQSVVPGRITNALWTRQDAEVIRVHLDNGEFIDSTPDHKFMLRDGSYLPADKLEVGQSLMPLYRRYDAKGYEQVYLPSSGVYKSTHQLSIISEQGPYPEGGRHVAHHKDFNKKNNNPENLVYMDKDEHFSYHADLAYMTLHKPDVVEKRLRGVKRWAKTQRASEIRLANLEKSREKQKKAMGSARHRFQKSCQMQMQWDMGCFDTEAFRQHRSQKLRESRERLKQSGYKFPSRNQIANFRDISFDELGKIAKDLGCKSKADLIRNGYSQCLVDRITRENGHSFREFSEKYLGGYKIVRKGSVFNPNSKWQKRLERQRLTQESEYKNHKVVKIEILKERRDCCDIEIQEHHNFATEAGVFVHNSQMDVRFAKTTMRLQRELKNGIRHICNVDLAARNIDPDKVEFKIGMVIPSGALEVAHIEVEKARIELAQLYQGLNFPDWWLYTKVLGLSEEEANEVEYLRAKQEGAFPNSEQQQEDVQRRVQNNIDRQNSSITRAHNAKQDAILESIEKGQSKLGRRLGEVKSLLSEYRKLRSA